MKRSNNRVAELTPMRMTIRIKWVPDFDAASAITRACSLDVMNTLELVDTVA